MSMRNDIGKIWETYGWTWWCSIWQEWRLTGEPRKIFPSRVVVLMKGLLCGETLDRRQRCALVDAGINPDNGERLH